MDMEVQSRLSFYRELAPLGDKENICLVKHVENEQIYVRKILDTYDADIYKLIQTAKVQNVPHIYECLESDGRLYVIEEYIQGITLEKFIEQYGTVNENTACQIVECLCQILDHFHNLYVPVIHRDIKPANVMLKGVFTDTDVDMQGVYLIDFNTARHYNMMASRDTVLMGTRGFAAPEQYGFSQSDARTDIYALGVLINYMLTGRIVAEGIYQNDPRINWVIKRATDMSPDRRYQRVSDMALDLYYIRTGTEEKSIGIDQTNEMQSSSEIKDTVDISTRHKVMRFFPPGFRRGSVEHMIIGALCYIVLLWFCFTVTVKDGKTGESITGNSLTAYRIVYFIMFFGLALLWGNYLNVWSHIPFLKSGKRIVRGFAVLLYTVIWIILVLVWFALVDNIFKI